MTRLALIACLFLTACGAAGVPEAPETGITMSGSVEMGVAADGGA